MEEKHIYPYYHRTFAKIDLDAIEHNFNALKGRLHKGVLSCCVVKADAYGHGAVPVAGLLEDKADYFAVAVVDEAVELRRAGIKKPILVLSYTSPLQYELLSEYAVTATVYNYDEAQELSALGEKRGKKIPVHLAVDTGMGRIGLAATAAGADTAAKISKLHGILLEGLFSHYAKADFADKTSAREQTERFDKFIALLEERGVNIPIKHLCNSAGIIDMEKQYDMVRMGISLYGMYPSDEVDKSKAPLLPAMEVISHVIHVKQVEKGTPIGYGHIWTAPETRTIATVSVGYADGYRRCLTGVGYVLIGGKKAPIRGKVCMDQIMVDVTHIPEVAVGDHAVLLGKSGDEEISAEALGEMSHSFSYETVCAFSSRVRRLYYRGGKLCQGNEK